MGEFIKDATSEVIFLDHNFINSNIIESKPKEVKSKADETKNIVAIPINKTIEIKIDFRNPQSLDLELEVIGTGADKVSIDGSYKQYAIVTIANPSLLEQFDLTIKGSFAGGRPIREDYKLPKMEGRNFYTLTVNSGAQTGAGEYLEGTEVLITADDPPDGKVFDNWTSNNGGTFGNDKASNTIFTMPESNVSVTATFKDKIAQEITASTYEDGITSATVGELIKTADGSYTPNHGGTEGNHNYKWYRADLPTAAGTEITGAASKDYTPVPADFGKYIWIETTPVGDGSLEGEPVASTRLRVGIWLEVKTTGGSGGTVDIGKSGTPTTEMKVYDTTARDIAVTKTVSTDIVNWTASPAGGSFDDPAEATTKYTPPATPPETGKITLTAVLTSPYTVTFNASGGTPTPSLQLIAHGNKVTRPADPVRTNNSLPTTPGLYRGQPGYFTFVEWRKSGSTVAWNFDTDIVTSDITLNAEWVDLALVPGVTTLDQACTYINSNPGTYGLFFNSNQSVEGSSTRGLTETNAKLTIMGIGSERTISLSNTGGRILTVGASGKTGIELILGNNITLNGIDNNNNSVVHVNNGATLTMLAGSKVAGNSSNVNGNDSGAVTIVSTSTISSRFNMEGGTITGNYNTNSTMYMAGGLFAGNDSIINISGGSITGNTGNAGDVVTYERNTFTLSGNASIGVITLSSGTNNENNCKLTIDSVWTGNITSLHLRGNNQSNVAPENINVTYHVNKTILTGAGVNATTVGRIGLGNFYGYNTSHGLLDIGSGYMINASGVLVGPTVLTNITTDTELQNAINTINNNTGGFYKIEIKDDITGDGFEFNGNNTVIINGGSKKIIGDNSASDILKVTGGSNVTIVDLHIVGDNSGSAVSVTGGGTFTMDGDSSISGQSSNSTVSGAYGAGVNVYGGTFIMKDGVIYGNILNGPAARGAGVHVWNGTFIMEGGVIRNNEITNTSGSGYDNCGAGVHLFVNAEFIMTGGVIYGNDNGPENNNTAGRDGHAVYIRAGQNNSATIFGTTYTTGFLNNTLGTP